MMAVWWFKFDNDGGVGHFFFRVTMMLQHRILRSGSTSSKGRPRFQNQHPPASPLSSLVSIRVYRDNIRTAARHVPRGGEKQKTSAALLLHAHCIDPPKIDDNGQSLLPSTFLLLPLEEATAFGFVDRIYFLRRSNWRIRVSCCRIIVG